MGDRIIITTEGDRMETDGMIKALVTVDHGQVQGQLKTEIELDALNVENMTILQGTV